MAASLLLAAACSGAASSPAPPSAPAAEGAGSTDDGLSASPGPVIDVVLLEIAVGYEHFCGLKPEGTAACWGRYHHSPERAGLTQLTAGNGFACGLTGSGKISCWGDEAAGKIIDAPTGNFRAVDVGRRHGCALTADAGRAVCWGNNNHGQTDAPPEVSFTEIQAGWAHSCGLTDSGGLRCWGANRHGEGDARSGPFNELAVGGRNTCALRTDGTAFCQGESRLWPPATAFRQIGVGGNYACGLTDAGGLECWGGGRPGPAPTECWEGGRPPPAPAECWERRPPAAGGAGRLEDGRPLPLPAPPGEFAALQAGLTFACARRPDGKAECWEPSNNAANAFAGRIFSSPVELFPWPGGGLAAAKRLGSISLHFPEAPPRLLLDLTGRVSCCEENSGLLSAALHPEFRRFPYLYVWYTVKKAAANDYGQVRLSRIPVVDGIPELAGELVILELPYEEARYMLVGGAIRFGPDGMLYLGLGYDLRPEAAQDLGVLWGSILRLEVRGATPEQPYRIPPDNPLRATPGARPEIYAYGLRNPWRMSFDSQGRLWVGDVGASAQEEISLVTAGANLGWPVFEGFQCRADEAQCAALTGAAPPVLAYGRQEGCAVIWGGEYQGRALPQLRGAQLFADYCTRKVWALENRPETGWQKRELAEVDIRITSFGTDAAGEMYLLPVSGPIVRLDQLIPAEPAEP